MSKKIININGPGEKACGCGNWLKHWEKLSGRKQRLCPEINCDNPATVGVRVMKDGGDGRWYIIPLCHAHGALSGQELEVVEAATLVSAEGCLNN